MKYVIPAAMLLVSAAPAFAQTALSQTDLVEVDDRAMVESIGRDADAIGDMDVYDADMRQIGEVEEVVGPDAETASALVIEFEDGLDEYGSEDRIVPLDLFTVEGDIVTFTGTAADVSDMGTWRDD